ncbi:acyltransferase [Terrabacter sp. NPDC080008]|uniref:acyltransferase family protein n=1 Tax=Terrabacter sp. NPDC080008 TaxID=3155176 RepID=UPI00344EF93C
MVAYLHQVDRGVRVAALDGIRGVAILLVLLGHVVGFTGAGLVGVLVFFVLSGYLITSVIVRGVNSTGRLDLKRFYVHRALRLLPVLLLVIAFVFALTRLPGSGVDLGDTVTGAWQGLAYVTDFSLALTQSFSPQLAHLWSLAVEEHFYLVWPLVMGLLLRRSQLQRRRALVMLISAAMLMRLATVVIGRSLGWFFYAMPTVWFECLLAGGALALLEGQMRPLRGGRPGATLIGTLAAAVLLGAALHPSTYLSTLTYLLGIPVLALATVGIIWAARQAEARAVRRVLEWAPLRWLGDRSYALYLFNSPCILVSTSLLGHNAGARLAGGTVAVVISMLTLRFVERPALGLKARFDRSRATPSSADVLTA